MRNEYKKVRYLLYLSIKMKINPISFCFFCQFLGIFTHGFGKIRFCTLLV